MTITFLIVMHRRNNFIVYELHHNKLFSISYFLGAFRELSLILKELRVITDKIRDDEDTAAIENDWKFAAMVLDRLCLLTFTAFTIIATVAVLLAAPHIIVT